MLVPGLDPGINASIFLITTGKKIVVSSTTMMR
jgi:hypothetical protein